MNTQYSLRCLGSGKEFEDDDGMLDSGNAQPAFLRTIYSKKQLSPGPESDGLFRFADWLPMHRRIEGSSAPITFKSTGLGPELGLNNLYLTFSGYWPEKSANMVTGTFKECEAFSVCARMPETFDKVLVVASAGNTARAFIHVCSKNNIPLAVVVPEKNLNSIWADHDVNPCVKLIAAAGDSDYFDAINLSRMICTLNGFVAEGGAKNVGRRDGMSCTVMSAVTTIGTIPEYYFQAVGSGTGAIAAWEANLRFLEDGRFGSRKMKLIVSQNKPFLVLYNSWNKGSRDLCEVSADDARALVPQTYAKVLSNRLPPYSIIGGLYDALADGGGDVLAVDNQEALHAGELFMKTEGIDPAPAASVALASLKQARDSGLVSDDSLIMVNVTGGGYERLKREGKAQPVVPSAVIDPEDIKKDSGCVERVVRPLFKQR